MRYFGYLEKSRSKREIYYIQILQGPFLWLKWAASYGTIIVLGQAAPAVLGPNILSKGVETGPTATQFGPACAQTMSRLPGAHLRQVERGAYPLFLPQKELFSSFCCRTDFSLVSAAGLTFLLCSKTFYCAIKLPAVQ